MGVRRSTRQSPAGLRAERRTGREIPHIEIAPGRPPRDDRKQLPSVEPVKSRTLKVRAKAEHLEL